MAKNYFILKSPKWRQRHPFGRCFLHNLLNSWNVKKERKIQFFSKFRGFCVGLSNGNIAADKYFIDSSNSYAIMSGSDLCWISEKKHRFECPTDAIKPKWNDQGDVIGCGLLISQEDKVSIFFTANGVLIGLFVFGL
jgi:hypothetical protein